MSFVVTKDTTFLSVVPESEPITPGPTYTAGIGVTIDGSNQISIGQSVANTDSPIFTDLTIGSTGSSGGTLNIQDFTDIGTDTIAQVKGIVDGTNGGELQLYSKEDGGALIRRLSINNTGTIYGDLLNLDSIYHNIHFGINAGNNVTGSMENNIFIGKEAGQLLSTGNSNVCIGYLAGQDADTNASDFIAIGNQTCLNKAGNKSINIGLESGYTKSPIQSINIGQRTAYFNANHTQGNESINIGNFAGETRPNSQCINIGAYAGNNGNSPNCVNIGNQAGRLGSGRGSVNIGAYANVNGSSSRPRVICINATENTLNSQHPDSCVIKPLRQIDHKIGFGLLYYDQVTGELSSSNTNITRFEAVFTTDPTDITTSGSTIVFDTTNYNVNGAYSISTGQFTSPRNALYRFECFYQLSTNDSLTLDWKRNGSVDKTEEVYNAHGGSSYRTFTASWTGVLNTGDTLEIAISATSGTIRFSSAIKNGLIGYYIGL